jgi:enoyl-[acyl-carrier-protein] reductase (NADH)
VVGLPFAPFDIFDWMIRVLPGLVIALGIVTMVAAIRASHFGPTDEGASVVINYASAKQDADRVVDEISKAGGKAIAIQDNVAKKGEVERLFTQAEKAFGKIDILVNQRDESRCRCDYANTREGVWLAQDPR